LLTADQLDTLVEAIHTASGGSSRLATGAVASNLDLYQVNCTFYDALGRDDEAYLIARAIQFIVPGIPQVYYVGLLAGENDMALLARSQVGRDINRHHYTVAEITAALERPVVQDLCDLIRLRNSHPAFNGEFHYDATDHTALTLSWTAGEHSVELRVSFRDLRVELLVSGGGRRRRLPLRCGSPTEAAVPAAVAV
jgi:sucrose phosphorylase